MPNTKSSDKRLRQAVKRTELNNKVKQNERNEWMKDGWISMRKWYCMKIHKGRDCKEDCSNCTPDNNSKKNSPARWMALNQEDPVFQDMRKLIKVEWDDGKDGKNEHKIFSILTLDLIMMGLEKNTGNGEREINWQGASIAKISGSTPECTIRMVTDNHILKKLETLYKSLFEKSESWV